MTTPVASLTPVSVPFFRPSISEAEIKEVTDTLRSGWLTTGPKVKRFESEFAACVRAGHAIALNSCTAALHLAVEALRLRPGQGVLVPAMTFAATAEVVRYQGGVPILVDCEADTLNMDMEDAARKVCDLRAGRLPASLNRDMPVVGVIPTHVGGLMLDLDALHGFANARGLWVVEDAAHAFPAAWRASADDPWQRCGEASAEVTCFSFYANKTITTGEGGIAVTNNPELAERIRMMSLHGLSHDAWDRYSARGSWDYQITAPGFKYNLTDIAAAIGIHQLARAEQMRQQREAIAKRYASEMAGLEEVETPKEHADRVHSYHLFPIKLRLERMSIGRNEFIEELKRAGIGCSVHWRPLHLHPYYQQTFGWRDFDLPVASQVWERLVSLPIFPGISDEEIERVVGTVRAICARYSIARP
jgi:dTDP-4-amino-4,6-dideoxygalactose transaminase